MTRQIYRLNDEQRQIVQRMMLRVRAAEREAQTAREQLGDALALIRPSNDASFSAEDMAFIVDRPGETETDISPPDENS